MSPTTTTTREQENTRTLTALMIVTVFFALIGNEINKAKAGQFTKTDAQGNTPSDPVTVGGRIILGGATATVVLILVSHAGEPGRVGAIGLATIAAVTTTLVYGGPVWSTISNIFSGAPGGKPTGTTSSTTPTNPTAPTHGAIPTASALSNLA